MPIHSSARDLPAPPAAPEAQMKAVLDQIARRGHGFFGAGAVVDEERLAVAQHAAGLKRGFGR